MRRHFDDFRVFFPFTAIEEMDFHIHFLQRHHSKFRVPRYATFSLRRTFLKLCFKCYKVRRVQCIFSSADLLCWLSKSLQAVASLRQKIIEVSFLIPKTKKAFRTRGPVRDCLLVATYWSKPIVAHSFSMSTCLESCVIAIHFLLLTKVSVKST